MTRWRQADLLRRPRSRPTLLLNAQSSRDRQNPAPGQDFLMAPGIRPFLVVLCLGQILALWWMAGQYSPGDVPAAEPRLTVKPALVVWTADDAHGKVWGNNDGKKVIDWDGPGVGGTGKALTIRFEGAGWRGWG